MVYEKPEIKEVSLDYENDKEIRFGKDTKSGCSGSCCYAADNSGGGW